MYLGRDDVRVPFSPRRWKAKWRKCFACFPDRADCLCLEETERSNQIYFLIPEHHHQPGRIALEQLAVSSIVVLLVSTNADGWCRRRRERMRAEQEAAATPPVANGPLAGGRASGNKEYGASSTSYGRHNDVPLPTSMDGDLD